MKGTGHRTDRATSSASTAPPAYLGTSSFTTFRRARFTPLQWIQAYRTSSPTSAVIDSCLPTPGHKGILT